MEKKNLSYLEMEHFAECLDCSSKLHQLCVWQMDQIWRKKIVYDGCLKKKNAKRNENKYNARRLQTTKLSTHIETKVNAFLTKKKAGAGEVTVRVVHSTKKMVEVKPGMKSRFVDKGALPEQFPYIAKAVFAFEEIDGVDVCFFGMHVQEYGSECPQPNQRHVYMKYLDMANFFQPKQFRQAVSHEILSSYLNYVKKLGYTMAHIWVCNPSKEDDYIFHCHPNEKENHRNKTRQLNWYKAMLDQCIIERTVLDYNDILKQAKEDKLQSAAELPYFEGDFWPHVLEECIKELDQEEEKRQQTEAAEVAISLSASKQICNIEGEGETDVDDNKKCNEKMEITNKIESRHRRSSTENKFNTPQLGDDLCAKIYAAMEKHRDDFLVIRLHSAESAASLEPIRDPDPFIARDLTMGRDV